MLLRRRRSSPLAVYLVVLTALLAISLIVVLPVDYDYYALSTSEKGHRNLVEHGASWSTSPLRGVDANKTLLVVARRTPISSSELEELVDFTSRGGVVVAYGSREFTESLLRGLGLSVVYWGLVLDPVFSENSPRRVLVELSEWNTSVTLNTPYVFNITGTPSRGELEYAAYTSIFSFVDGIVENGVYDIGEHIGEFPVIYTLRVNSGVLVVVCAQGVFTNSVLRENSELLKLLASGGRSIVLDQSEFESNILAYFKLLVVTPRGVSPLLVLVLSVVIIVVLYYVYSRGGIE